MTTDPMSGYLPIEHFQETDDDHSTVRIRDMPYGKRRESLVIYPIELTFPNTATNTSSASYPIMITNDGYDIVVISEIKVVGDFIASGSITEVSPLTLHPGQHESLQVTFNPKHFGTSTGGIYLNSGSAAGQEFISLTGTSGVESGITTVSPFYFGAKGDGIVDDTKPISDAIAAVSAHGGIVDITGGLFAITSMTVAPNVTIKGLGTWGEVLPGGTWGPPTDGRFDYRHNGLLIMPGTGTVTLKNRSCLDGIGLMTPAVITPPTSGAQALAVVVGYTGIGVTITGDDALVTKCMIMGYNTGVYSGPTNGLTGPERSVIRRSRFDCTNGIEATDSLDVGRVEGNWLWPFYSTGHNTSISSAGGELGRRHGIAINLHDKCDGWYVNNNFTYGYNVGIRLKEVSFVRCTDNLCDNARVTSPAPLSGILTEGYCNLVDLSGSCALEHTVNFDFQHINGMVTAGSIEAGGSGRCHVRIGAGGRIALGSVLCAGGASVACIEIAAGVVGCAIQQVVFEGNTPHINGYYIALADVKNVWIGRTITYPNGAIDNMGTGIPGVPMMRMKQDVMTGFVLSNTDINVHANGVTSTFLRSVANAVNWLSIRSSALGQPVDIYAEGTDDNIHLRLTASGTGEVRTAGVFRANTNQAIVAGGALCIYLGQNNIGIYSGSGVPTVVAVKGSLYLRSDGTGPTDRIYVNHNSSTGWTALTTTV